MGGFWLVMIILLKVSAILVGLVLGADFFCSWIGKCCDSLVILASLELDLIFRNGCGY